MRILVTNDDGIDSAGLHVLAQRLTELGDVTVFAPSGDYSGAGAAIGHLGPGLPPVHRVALPEMPDVAAAYHLDGPPALATLLACTGLLGEIPHVVVSGINPGWNVGHAVHFSGTIGAGVTARVFGIPAIATSQQVGPTQHWITAADAAADLLDDVMATPRLLNVNVPNRPQGEIKGMKNTTLSGRLPYGLHSPTLNRSSKSESSSGARDQPVDGGTLSDRSEVYPATFERNGPFEQNSTSDTTAVTDGYVSITELQPTHAVG